MLVAVVAALLTGVGLVLVIMGKLDTLANPAAATSSQTVIGWVLVGVGIAAALVAGLLMLRTQGAQPPSKCTSKGGRRDR